jgi:hypothetical protein
MTISRAYSAGWSIGEIVTSSQLNGLDNNTTYAIDKRDGYGDFFSSVIQATGSGRIISTLRTGGDTDESHAVIGGQIVRVPTLTAPRTYSLLNAFATGGDRISYYVEGTGHSPSGYVDIVTSQGTGLFRLGMSRGFYATGIAGWNDSAQGDACEVLFNGTGWELMRGGSPGMRSISFTSTATTEWVCPPGVFSVLLFGYGGGGGGGAGTAGGTSAYGYAGSGAGGGAAWPRWYRLPVAPGRVYEAIVGDGGAGGASAGSSGSPGGDSIFREKSSGNVLATFRGADYGAVAGSVPTNISEAFGFGGSPVRNPNSIERSLVATGVVKSNVIQIFPSFLAPGCGGFGTTSASATTRGQDGIASPDGYAGGAQGAQGTADSSYFGGGGGGGGGGGPGGAGGAGGAGGNGNSSATSSGTAGSSGTAAAANSGAGGGGGGAGGGGAGGGGAAGLGGAGGTGKIVLVFFK